jgi:hypothetical protein
VIIAGTLTVGALLCGIGQAASANSLPDTHLAVQDTVMLSGESSVGLYALSDYVVACNGLEVSIVDQSTNGVVIAPIFGDYGLFPFSVQPCETARPGVLISGQVWLGPDAQSSHLSNMSLLIWIDVTGKSTVLHEQIGQMTLLSPIKINDENLAVSWFSKGGVLTTANLEVSESWIEVEISESRKLEGVAAYEMPDSMDFDDRESTYLGIGRGIFKYRHNDLSEWQLIDSQLGSPENPYDESEWGPYPLQHLPTIVEYVPDVDALIVTLGNHSICRIESSGIVAWHKYIRCADSVPLVFPDGSALVCDPIGVIWKIDKLGEMRQWFNPDALDVHTYPAPTILKRADSIFLCYSKWRAGESDYIATTLILKLDENAKPLAQLELAGEVYASPILDSRGDLVVFLKDGTLSTIDGNDQIESEGESVSVERG